jgi:hypothetical protein
MVSLEFRYHLLNKRWLLLKLADYSSGDSIVRRNSEVELQGTELRSIALAGLLSSPTLDYIQTGLSYLSEPLTYLILKVTLEPCHHLPQSFKPAPTTSNTTFSKQL